MADDEHIRVRHLGGDPGFLGTRDQMVDKDAEPGVGTGRETGHDGGEVVNAF
jgi:hypothetical protein